MAPSQKFVSVLSVSALPSYRAYVVLSTEQVQLINYFIKFPLSLSSLHENMSSADTLSVGSDDEDNVSIAYPKFFRSINKLAKSNDPNAREAGLGILSSFHFKQNTVPTAGKKRQSDAAVSDKNPSAKKRKTKETDKRARDKRNKSHKDEWTCEHAGCDRVFSSKSYLERHINNEHATKRRRLVLDEVFECNECDSEFGTEAALKEHENTHASCSNAPKTTKYACVLCGKYRSGIYAHYCSMHKIEYPEQILSYSGNSLVRSDIDTKGGKAPWFIREKEKVTQRYKDTTCRLCETNLDDAEMLDNHYTLMHMVGPQYLKHLNYLFRATKGSHLGVSASQPKPRFGDASTPIKEHDSSPVEGTENGIIWPCDSCDRVYNYKQNLKRHVAAKHSGKREFGCGHCGNIFDTETLLNKHKDEKHTKTDKSVSKTHKCALCLKNITGIYKHYGNVHNIEYPEQIMIQDGNVLVLSHIDTKGGRAAWFIKEKAKMQSLKPFACRLCETEFGNSAMLQKHYQWDHKITPSALQHLKHMFRATKGAHLADLPNSQTPSRRKHRVQSSKLQNDPRGSDNKTDKCKPAASGAEHKKKKLIIPVEKKGVNSMILYQCEECEVAASSYDACVEHAQLHQLAGYAPIAETCHICNFSFEPQCFSEHEANHRRNTEPKILKYNPSNLLSDEWFSMFQGLPETMAEQIKSASIYVYTRGIKINCDEVTGIVLYECSMCQLYVDPEEVEEHCYNKNACINNKSKDYYCSECDLYFYSHGAINKHYNEHKKGLTTSSFRKATFNCKQDGTVNKALQELKSKSLSMGQAPPRDEHVPSPVEESPVGTQRGNRQPIEILEDRVVSVFCDFCSKSILYCDFEAHAALHQSYQNVEYEDDHDQITEEVDEGNCDVISQNRAAMTERNNDGIAKQQNSDNDSNLRNSTYVVHVEVHVQREEVTQNNREELVNRSSQSCYNTEDMIDESAQNENNNAQPNSVVDGGFSERMVNDFESDLQNLFQEIETESKSSSAADENHTTQDLLNVLDNNPTVTAINDTDAEIINNKENENAATSQDIFASDPTENKESIRDSQMSTDMFCQTNETQCDNVIINNDLDTNNNGNENASANTIETIDLVSDNEDNATENDARQSLKKILTRILTDGDPVANDDDDDDSDTSGEGGMETERQSFINETQRIRELMSSRE